MTPQERDLLLFAIADALSKEDEPVKERFRERVRATYAALQSAPYPPKP